MKRKLISYDAFNQLESQSLTKAAHELSEAANLVSKLLESQAVKLHSLDATHVMYEMADGTYMRANYNIQNNKIQLSNIEQIVIDEATLDNSIKECLKGLVEALAEQRDAEAETMFNKYVEMASPKFKFGKHKKTASEKICSNARTNYKNESSDEDDEDEDCKETKKDKKENPFTKFLKKKKKGKHKDAVDAATEDVKKAAKGKKKKSKIPASKMEEWTKVASNVLDYVQFMANSPAMSESTVMHNDRGDVEAISLPTAQIRAEGKVLDYKYKGLKSDVKVLREQALLLSTNTDFQKTVAEVKKHNNLSDNDALEESINGLVANFPVILYLTQEELSKVIGEALTNRGVSNFDDNTCTFMAEGILRTAHGAYPERVNRLVFLSGNNIEENTEDAYLSFQDIVKDFYLQVDEAFQVESRVFKDLKDAFIELHETANEMHWKEMCDTTVQYISRLESVVSGEARPNLTLAERAAAFLAVLSETNLESEEWLVTKQPYTTMVGEHPDMIKKAKQGYSPASDFSGNWNDPAPTLDDEGGSYRGDGANKLRNHAWGNLGGNDTYPSLSNPIIPKAAEFKIKNEKDVKDSDDSLAQWGSGDTVPGLDNPYIPKSIKLHANDKNLVDDIEVKL